MSTFEYNQQQFLLDGKPFQIISGEMHFARVPREYWRHRLQMARAMGLNTVCAYMFWNHHEPEPGHFCFEGDADVAAYVRMAQEEGLGVILRPGPYACAEWDFGGLPSWLLAIPDIQVRCSDKRYLSAVRSYLLRVGKELADLQVEQGGPILMVQVENEYGSFGNDADYLAALRDITREAGFTVPLFTCDGPHALGRGSLPDVLPVINFGRDPGFHFEHLREFRHDIPVACGEYYPGWFDHWGGKHQLGETPRVLEEIGDMFRNGASFSIYMFHGGTSFGFGSGANHGDAFMPQTTSYDYDAPLDEAGRITPKYCALRELLGGELEGINGLPAVPAANPIIEIPEIQLTESAALFDNLGVSRRESMPRSMEMLGQSQGCVLYRTQLPAGSKGKLTIQELHDYGQVFLDGQRVAVLDRRLKQNSLQIEPIESDQPVTLDILVEAMGHVNYGQHIIDRKGITEKVILEDVYTVSLMGWDIFSLPLDEQHLQSLKFQSVQVNGPAFHRGTFSLSQTGDTFLDMRGWHKGMVWINGHNLGRYWHIGPQQTLYVPGPWLREGQNEIIVLDLEGVRRQSLRSLSEPVLDEPSAL
ncbi:beta-galactosidase [bacterium]|nr:MAG: beta-galactosidase [bacterium]